MNLFQALNCALIIMELKLSLQKQLNDANTCTLEKKCSENYPDTPAITYRNYNEAFNKIVKQIENATGLHKPCSNDPEDKDCQCHLTVLENDLAQFNDSAITHEMIKNSAKYGTRYKILQHKLYRDRDCMFPSRCEGIEHFILKLLPQLPNMDLVVNTRDWPQVLNGLTTKAQQRKIVFSFSKTANYVDVMYPAWTFWSGGPAISLYPTGIGRWDLHRERLTEAARKFPWSKKERKGFFRGSRTSDERDSLILLSRKKPELVDAQYTKNQAWKSLKDTLNAEPASEVSFEDHCRYKYLFNFRGVAASFRLKHLFLCKSLVFHVGNDWLEFFYPSLKPWVHYVPLNKYPAEEQIEEIVEFFKHHDNLAREIAERGYKFIWDHLRMDDIECYWKILLTKYAKLLKYVVKLDESMIEIKVKKK